VHAHVPYTNVCCNTTSAWLLIHAARGWPCKPPTVLLMFEGAGAWLLRPLHSLLPDRPGLRITHPTRVALLRATHSPRAHLGLQTLHAAAKTNQNKCHAQDLLLDNLQLQLDAAIAAPAGSRADAIHEFTCKAEEVHVTLQKHLRKEEEQLFPLVLQHFTFQEQADLVVCPRLILRAL
jgi:hypothetical protein